MLRPRLRSRCTSGSSLPKRYLKPPVIAIISNRPDDVPESYKRYLDNGFREAWGFKGVPLHIKFGSRGARQLARDKGDGRR